MAALCAKVESPGRNNWNKLVQLMKFLSAAKCDALTPSAGKGALSLMWCMDASFAAHPDFRSHSRLVGKFVGGEGAVASGSDKQKLNADSSTTAELAATHQHIPKMLFAPLFLSELGCDVDENEIFQDNKSAILLEKNGRKSAGKCTRALNMRHFSITDQSEKGNLKITCCHTDEMIADFFTKGLVGPKFEKFRREVMGFN